VVEIALAHHTPGGLSFEGSIYLRRVLMLKEDESSSYYFCWWALLLGLMGATDMIRNGK
jgi:hypothetical protein